MLLVFESRTDLLPGQTVKSNKIVIENTGIDGDVISIDRGSLYVNDVPVGTSHRVFPDDNICIQLSSPNDNGQSAHAIVRSNGQIVGYFAVVTQNTQTFSYDTRYDSRFAFDPPVDVGWTAGSDRSIVKLNADGVVEGTYDLDSAPVSGKATNAVVVLDYHRDNVTVFNTSTNTVLKTIAGGGPCAELSVYDSDFIKIGQVIAFNKDNQVVVLDDTFSVASSFNFVNPAHIAHNGNFLYVSALNSNKYTRYNFNLQTLEVSSPAEFTLTEIILGIVPVGNDVYFATESGLVNTIDSVVAATDDPIRSMHYDLTSNTVLASHGIAGNASVINMTTFAVSKITIPNAVFIDTVYMLPDGRTYLVDTETKKLHIRGPINRDIDLGFPALGIAATGSLYVGNIYPDLPSKISTDPLIYELDSTEFVDVEDVPIGSSGATGEIAVISANKLLNVSLIPTDTYATLLKNGSPVSSPTTVTTNDVLSIGYTYDYDLHIPIVLALVVDQQVFHLEAYADNQQIVPFNMVFESQLNRPTNTYIQSNGVLVSGLDRPVEVTSPNATIFIDGFPVTQPHLLENGQTVSLEVLTPPTDCSNIVGLLDFEGRFQAPFMVSTPSVIDPQNPPYLPTLEFGQKFDCPLGAYVYSDITMSGGYFDPIELIIPDIFEATFFRSGQNLGRSVVLLPNTTGIQIRVKTTYNYDAPHHIPVHSCLRNFSFIAWTDGDNIPDEFDFGFIDGVSIKDRLLSDVVTFNGIGNNVKIDLRLPYNTRAIVNGIRLPFSSNKLDWRDVLLRDNYYTVEVSRGDTIQLEGFGRPDHGTLHKFPVYIGARKGFWTIKTYDLEDVGYDVRHSQGEIVSGYEYTYTNNIITLPEHYDIADNWNAPVVTTTAPSAEVGSTGYLYADNPRQAETTSAPVLSSASAEVYADTSHILVTSLDSEVETSGSNLIEVEPNYTFGVSANAQYVTDLNKGAYVNPTSGYEVQTYFNEVNAFVNGQVVFSQLPEFIVNRQSSEIVVNNPREYEFHTFAFYESVAMDPVPSLPIDVIVYTDSWVTVNIPDYLVNTTVEVSYTPVYMREQEVFNYAASPTFMPAYETNTHPWFITNNPEVEVAPPIKEVLYTPEYEWAAPPAEVVFTPEYVYEQQPATVSYDANYEIVAGSKELSVVRDQAIHSTSNEYFADNVRDVEVGATGYHEGVRSVFVIIEQGDIVLPDPGDIGVISCGISSASGGTGITEKYHELGPVPGYVEIEYNMFGAPDQMEVFYNNNLVLTTGGPVSYEGKFAFYYPGPGNGRPTACMVRMTGSDGTRWEYLVKCPQYPYDGDTGQNTADGPVYEVGPNPAIFADRNLEYLTVGSNQVIANIGIFDNDTRGTSYELAVPDVEYFLKQYERTPQPNQLHPGYFASHADAVADAYSWGAVNGTFYTIQVPEKGWAWTLIIECANLCNPNDCPPAGYIHGG